MTEPILLTIEDVMELLQLGRTRLYAEFGENGPTRLRFGKAVRIRRTDLEAWLERKAEEAEQERDRYDPWPPSPRR